MFGLMLVRETRYKKDITKLHLSLDAINQVLATEHLTPEISQILRQYANNLITLQNEEG